MGPILPALNRPEAARQRRRKLQKGEKLGLALIGGIFTFHLISFQTLKMWFLPYASITFIKT